MFVTGLLADDELLETQHLLGAKVAIRDENPGGRVQSVENFRDFSTSTLKAARKVFLHIESAATTSGSKMSLLISEAPLPIPFMRLSP